MHSLACLMFDVDGTLANTEDAHRQAFNQVFSQYGFSWHWDQSLYKQLLRVSGGVERILHYVDSNGLTLPTEDRVAFVRKMHQEKTVYYNQLLQNGDIKLRSGVERLLLAARAEGVKMAITTTTSRVNVETLLQVNLGDDALSWFDVWVCGEQVERKKPDPEVYLQALRELALAPNQAVALEDSYNGVRAAKQAAIPCIVTFNEYTRDDDFNGAVMVLDRLGDPDKPARGISGVALRGDMLQLTQLDEILHQIQGA